MMAVTDMTHSHQHNDEMSCHNYSSADTTVAAVCDHAVEMNASFWFDVDFETGLLGFEGHIFGRGLVS